VSTALRPFSTEELSTLLERSRKRNGQAGITGMLLYKDGCFMQAFEGPKGEVQRLHAQIEGDPRHRNLIVLLDGPIPRREFSHWTMGFKELDGDNLEQRSGFSDLLNTLSRNTGFSTDPSLAKRLLLSFTQQPV